MATRVQRDEQELRTALYHLSLPNGSNPPVCAVVQTANSGMTYRATCGIPPGTLLLSEPPLFSIMTCQIPMTETNIIDLSIQVGRDRRAFNQLCCTDPQPTERRRFEVNSFQMSPRNTQGQSRRGIFVHAARFNHSCIPNAHVEWNQPLNRLTIHTILPISTGDDILINYDMRNWRKKRNDRRMVLQNAYDFWCSCVACSTSNWNLSTAGQSRRTTIVDLVRSIRIEKYNYKPTARAKRLDNIKMLREVLRTEELLYPALAKVYGWQAKWYRKELEGQQDRAVVQWSSLRRNKLEAAREKLMLVVMSTGHNSDAVRKTLDLIESLK